jgi:hypothetical protein
MAGPGYRKLYFPAWSAVYFSIFETAKLTTGKGLA